MIRPARRPTSATTWLLALLWLASLVQIFWPHPWIAPAAGVALSLYVALTLPRVRRQIQVLCAPLGLAAVALAILFDGWGALWQGIERAVVFAAFFGTLTLLRATADRRPEIARARQRVATLGPRERASGLMVGANVLGSVLVVGVMAIFAPIVGRDAAFEARKQGAEASQRGMCMASFWSPFWVGMSVCYVHLPAVPLWQLMALGIGMNALGLLTAQFLYTREVGPRGLWRALGALAPTLGPVGVAALVVVGIKAATPFSTLQCLILGIPLLCLAALAAQGARQLRWAVTQAAGGVGTMGGEITLLTFSFALGLALQRALEAAGVGEKIAALAPPPWVVIAAVVALIGILALAGIHQVVTATLALVLFGTLPFGVAELVLMESALVGWGFASMVGLSAVSVATAAAMFGVPLERLAYGPNMLFIAIFGVIAVAALALVNAAIF